MRGCAPVSSQEQHLVMMLSATDFLPTLPTKRTAKQRPMCKSTWGTCSARGPRGISTQESQRRLRNIGVAAICQQAVGQTEDRKGAVPEKSVFFFVFVVV